mmetsp:Transcript_60114/g.173379  ORF Transcript_60114/g.173379 Transcript_60114/m.173379 type:complete len:202 (+) Transcript_60114:414-1019(+)
MAMVIMHIPCPAWISWLLKNSHAIVASVSATEASPANCNACASSNRCKAAAFSSSSLRNRSRTSRCFATISSRSSVSPLEAFCRKTNACKTIASAFNTSSDDSFRSAIACAASSSASAKLPICTLPIATARMDEAFARTPPHSPWRSTASRAAFTPSLCLPKAKAAEATRNKASPSRWWQDGLSNFRNICDASRPSLHASS